MKLDRRDCLRLGAAVGAGAFFTGCDAIRSYTHPPQPDSIKLPPGPVEPIARLLNRVSFGPTPGEVARVARLGVERYIDEQLHPTDDEPAFLALRLRGIEALHTQALELQDEPKHEVLRQLQKAAILRAVYSPHQLRERMVEFWSNHFNIYAHKGSGAYFKPTDELSVIRKHALDKFPDLLRASAHSPAMLAYLDNQVNERKAPNENYARELMELHTLGVHGGYTQRDVQEVARCFTGWTVENRFLRPRGRFRFNPDLHDDGPKTVLGTRIPAGGGEKDAERVLDILAKHSSTARFIAYKICRYFLGEAAKTWTAKLAEIYVQTGGDIKAMLRPLLLSREILEGPPIIKRPFDYMVSALRALNANTDADRPLQEHLAHMGQPLYQWPMPDGYPDKTSAWTGSLLARWNFATALTTGKIAWTQVDLPGLIRLSHTAKEAEYAHTLIEIIFALPADQDSLRALRDRLARCLSQSPRWSRKERPLLAETAALVLASPEFQWR
ncbi:MAG TPA: DUF1800 domain-containing protein [Chthonomonadales bacterium]|nr:DUF1800 domain-containing protein [Chthonomonadales bacterium]